MFTKALPISLMAATATLVIAAALADAQPATQPIQPARSNANAAPAPDAGAKPACPACLKKHDATGETPKGASMKMQCPMMDAADCPMAAAAQLADIKVEMTKQGASIVLSAKAAADVTKVQELARELSRHLSGQTHAGQSQHHHMH